MGNPNEMEEPGDSAEVPPRPSREVTEEERFEFICKCPVLPVVLHVVVPMYGSVEMISWRSAALDFLTVNC